MIGMQIGAKMSPGVGALTLITVALGGLAIDRMAAMKKSAASMGDDDLASTEQVSAHDLGIENVRRFEAHHILAQDEATRRRIAADIAASERQEVTQFVDGVRAA